MRNLSILSSYEDVLLRHYVQYHLIGRDENPDIAVKSAKLIFYYCFECILHWTPYNIRDYFTPAIAEKLKLENCMESVPFPVELDQTRDYFFVASWLYPDIVPYQKDRVVIDIYEKIMNGIYKSYPKNFFHGDDGRQNLLIILRYNISMTFFSKSNEKIYEYFSVKKQASEYMKQIRLQNYWAEHYDIALDAVHDALPEGDKSELHYQFYKFQYYYRSARK